MVNPGGFCSFDFSVGRLNLYPKKCQPFFPHDHLIVELLMIDTINCLGELRIWLKNRKDVPDHSLTNQLLFELDFKRQFHYMGRRGATTRCHKLFRVHAHGEMTLAIQ